MLPAGYTLEWVGQAYQEKRTGITSVDERLDYETAKLNETSSQLTSIQAATTDSRSKRTQSDRDTVAEVMQSPLINGLKSDIARLEAKLIEGSVNLGKNPKFVRNFMLEATSIRGAMEAYVAAVKNGSFPEDAIHAW